MASIEELRAEARRLMEAVKGVSDARTKQELAARALELSQRAEALENAGVDPWTLRANISRYRSLLASGKLDADEVRISNELLAEAERTLRDIEKKIL